MSEMDEWMAITYEDDDWMNDVKLYSIVGIGIATFFGTILLGGIIMALNYVKLGKKLEALNTILITIIAMSFIFFLVLILKEFDFPSLDLTAPQFIVFMLLAWKFQGQVIEEHSAMGGMLESNLKVAGISVLFFLSMFLFLSRAGIFTLSQ
ncbi:hypothetical protein [Desulfoluna sp.]|uniref:hypothetical protein n=1 Tax=Desulfoluna sp. TaxID=2045199 RepID=UPI00260FB55F|nr:hypothetical protein [Desulfoluna sp.]